MPVSSANKAGLLLPGYIRVPAYAAMFVRARQWSTHARQLLDFCNKAMAQLRTPELSDYLVARNALTHSRQALAKSGRVA